MSHCKCYQDLVFFIKQRFMRNSLKNFRKTSMKLTRTSHQGYSISHPDFNGGVKISSFKLEKLSLGHKLDQNTLNLKE